MQFRAAPLCPVADISTYAAELDTAGKCFELRVSQGEPQRFTVRNGQLSESSVTKGACTGMARFFERALT